MFEFEIQAHVHSEHDDCLNISNNQKHRHVLSHFVKDLSQLPVMVSKEVLSGTETKGSPLL